MNINVEQLIKKSEMFNSLSETKQTKYKNRLLKQLNKKLLISPPKDDLSTILVENSNFKLIQGTVSMVWSFSWLGFFFGYFWAAHKKVPMAFFLSLLFIVPSWPFLFFDYDLYLSINDFLIKCGISLCGVYGMFGRSIAISDEISRYVISQKNFIDVKVMPPVMMLGMQIIKPWLRVLSIILFVILMLGVEVSLDVLIWGLE